MLTLNDAHELLESLVCNNSRGVQVILIAGPRGSGKSFLVRSAIDAVRCDWSDSLDVELIAPSPVDVFHSFEKTLGRTCLTSIVERALLRLWKTTTSQSGKEKCLCVLLDGFGEYFSFDNTCRNDDHELGGDNSNRRCPMCPALVAELYAMSTRKCFSSSDMPSSCRVLFLVTLVPHQIRCAELSPFQMVINIPAPTEAERADMLRSMLREMPLSDSEAPSFLHLLSLRLAATCGGVLPQGLAEVAQFARLALQSKINEETRGLGNEARGRVREYDPLLVAAVAEHAHQMFVLSKSQQSIAYRNACGFVDVSQTRWSDIAGLHSVKEQLQQLVVNPARYHKEFEEMGVSPSIGVILHGPPGTGKTMLARAMATELSASFVYLDLPHLLHSEVGESEKVLKSFFNAAKDRSPCVMFVDEIQAAFGIRYGTQGGDASTSHESRLVSTFLTLLDEVKSSPRYLVVFVGASNALKLLDPLVLRAGRLDVHIEVGVPDEPARRSLIERIVHGQWAKWWSDDELSSRRAKDFIVDESLRLSSGMSGAEIRNALNVFALTVFSRDTDTDGRSTAARICPVDDKIAQYARDALDSAFSQRFDVH